MTASGRAKSLPTDGRVALLRDLQSISRDADQRDAVSTFLPLPSHDLALRPEILVVRGERGSGKSALFQLVQELGTTKPSELARLFTSARLPTESRWVEGFSEAVPHPQSSALDGFLAAAKDGEVRGFWYAHLVGQLADAADERTRSTTPNCIQIWRERRHHVHEWAQAAESQIADLAEWLDDFNRGLTDAAPTWFVTYDYLDVLSKRDREARNRAISSLLALWTTFSNRYRKLRAKLFLREDLFAAATRSFPDASKLHGRSTSLDWSIESLYRVLIRVMAAQSEALAEWTQQSSNKVPLARDPLLGLLPPPLKEQGRPSIKAFVDHLAGERMGSGIRKAYTYRWIPARLQDGLRRIVPRSVVNLVAKAAEHALQGGPRAGHQRLLHPAELTAALLDTSKLRVAELLEEFPEVDQLSCIDGQQLPIRRQDFIASLDERLASEKTSTDLSAEQLLDEFVRIGVVIEREERRIDVPDLYRYHFRLKRKGGAGRSG